MHQSADTYIVSDQMAVEVWFVPPVEVVAGSFTTEETTPMMEVRTLSLISERAVYVHWERTPSLSATISR